MQNEKKSLVEQSFPFEHLSIIAERESWRKEVNRPTSYIHKWWARRLGSVFRGLIIGGAEDVSAPFAERYYQNTQYRNLSVFDPFMGSGTTITEAVKLGARVVGSDINPVAVAMVRAALEKYDRHEVVAAYNQIENRCAERIKHYYKAMHEGALVDVLYYFWVKTITCDDCGADIPLYKTTIFSKNAYASKKPTAQSICPHCSSINQIKYSDEETICGTCGKAYNPQKGNVSGIEYVCPVCGKHERIVEYARRTKKIIPSKLYAKMILDHHGNKQYLPADDYDMSLFEEAQFAVSEFEELIPKETIHQGTNTDQILNYNYRRWSDMFNARQLLSFGILMQEIKTIDDISLRRLFGILMSGTLEFNNMFCSFKGEGTGAVRPLFYNHILKSELMPLEANVWGCSCSSGAFSTLYKTRILRLLDYKEHPFELFQDNGFFVKKPLKHCNIQVSPTEEYAKWDNAHPLIMCRDSACSGIPEKTIDLVVTDPPFFDNVNYSELADFFYVWLRKLDIGIAESASDTTRASADVQDNDADRFSAKLSAVLKESCRVLKDDGMLIFTYHHSKTEGWISVYNAICGAGFSISEVFPIKAEMSVSVAIQAAKMPINYDLVFVCRKRDVTMPVKTFDFNDSEYVAAIKRIKECNLQFTEGDKTILLYGHILKQLSECGWQEIRKADIEKIFASTTGDAQISISSYIQSLSP
jgi:putative DNA methylase